MSSLKDRLALAQKRAPDVTHAQIASDCHISPAAVSKWFSGGSKKIKAEYVFIVARLYGVDPEWLALGRGKPDRNSASQESIAQKHRDLLAMYLRLPDELRFQVRGLITTMSAALSERHTAWSAQETERNKVRDAKIKEIEGGGSR